MRRSTERAAEETRREQDAARAAAEEVKRVAAEDMANEKELQLEKLKEQWRERSKPEEGPAKKGKKGKKGPKVVATMTGGDSDSDSSSSSSSSDSDSDDDKAPPPPPPAENGQGGGEATKAKMDDLFGDDSDESDLDDGVIELLLSRGA